MSAERIEPKVLPKPRSGPLAVLLPLPLDQTYDFLLSESFMAGCDPAMPEVQPGSWVKVAFSGRDRVGVVWDGPRRAQPVEPERLKPVLGFYDAPAMSADLRRLVEWIADYTLAPLGAVLRLCVGSPAALERETGRVAFAATPGGGDGSVASTPARRRVLALLRDSPPLPASILAAEAGCSPGVVRAMVLAGLLVETRSPGRAARPVPRAVAREARSLPPLSPDQAEAAAALRASVRAGRFEATLLDGVTGSGKTDVYFEAIAQALELDGRRQVLILLPEIALGATWQARFEARFGCLPVLWHSEVPPNQRRRAWRDVAEGSARVVVGARSALFLPFRKLALIVVDEEHDASYKQEDGVIYHGRDMAVVRARLADAAVVLASATPSLETLVNAERGRYRRLVLPARYGGASLPAIAALDLRIDRPARQRFIAPGLASAIDAALAAGEQAMLFLNRRGYAPLTLCRACGYRLQCPSCTAWLVEHRLIHRLVCHHCGHSVPVPQQCPACDDRDSFAACGPGVERLAEEAALRFPAARTAIMASDTLDRPSAAKQLLARIEAHEIDLLIGTQIMAKGHHFPLLTVVGVVDADLGLDGGDLRAAERTYQLLHQVAGRAGRAERPGRVLLQTYEPQHPVMQALISGRRDRFMAREAEARRERNLPPFGRLVALIVSGPDADQADLAAAALARAAPHLKGVETLGPAPAPLAILRGRHRRRFLVKSARQVNVQAVMREWLSRVRMGAAIRIQVDVDPFSFL